MFQRKVFGPKTLGVKLRGDSYIPRCLDIDNCYDKFITQEVNYTGFVAFPEIFFTKVFVHVIVIIILLICRCSLYVNIREKVC